MVKKIRITIVNKTLGGISGGYRKYLLNVLPRLSQSPDIDSIQCFSPSSWMLQDWFGNLMNVEFFDYDSFGYTSPRDKTNVNKLINNFAPDVIYVPVERCFSYKGKPVVNMIRNMEPYAKGIKASVFENIKKKVKYLDAKRALKNSDRVLAVSKFVKNFVMNKWKIPDEKIGLVYHGIDPPWKIKRKKPKSIYERLEGRFVFTVGSIRPARGLEDILCAISNLDKDNNNSLKLVIAGSVEISMGKYSEKLKSLVQQKRIEDKVIWAGNLNESEMKWCYENCFVFVMTSRVESFGMVALEAMNYGSICISANNPCLPEIFADSALYYEPGNSKHLSEKIAYVMKLSENERNTISISARKRASNFTWDITVEKTVNELINCVKNI